MAEQQTPPDAIKGGVLAYLSMDSSAVRAGDFYRQAFGAEQVFLQPPDDKGRTMHLHLHINGSSVMISDCFPENGHSYVPPAGFNLMLPVEGRGQLVAARGGCRLHRAHAARKTCSGATATASARIRSVLSGVRWRQKRLMKRDSHALISA